MKIFLNTFVFITLIYQSQTFAINCIFGEDILNLTQKKSDYFDIIYLGQFIKIARTDIPGETIRIQIYELKDKKTGEIYHLNYTDEDQFDGGNSLGWIERLETLEVVATIQDSQIYNCKIIKPKEFAVF